MKQLHGLIVPGLRGLLLLTILVALVGAGHAPQPVAAQSTLATFDIGTDVSDQDAGFVIEGVRIAQDFFIEHIGASIDIPVNVMVLNEVSPVSESQIAVSRDDEITVYAASPGWQLTSPAERYAVIVHEYAHFYQYLLLRERSFDSPAWFDEGIAEYLSVIALSDWGVIEQSDFEQYWSTLLSLEPIDESFKQLESWPIFQQSEGATYPLAYFGVAALFDDGDLNPVNAYYSQLASGESFDDSFTAAFGLTPDQHYANLAEDLQAPSPSHEIPADILTYRPIVRTTTVKASGLPRILVAGDQVLIQATALPASVCSMTLIEPGSGIELVERTTFADGTGDVYWFVTIPYGGSGGLVNIDMNCGGESVSRAAILE